MERTVRIEPILMAMLVLPVLIALLPRIGLSSGTMWTSGTLLICGSVIWLMVLVEAYRQSKRLGTKAAPRILSPDEIPPVISDVMDVSLATEESGTRIYRGFFREPSIGIYNRLKRAFQKETVVLLPQAIMIAQGPIAASAGQRSWMDWLMVIAALAITFWTALAV